MDPKKSQSEQDKPHGFALWLKLKATLAWLKRAVMAMLIAGSFYIGVAQPAPVSAATYDVGNYTELVTAINAANASPEDDVIRLTGAITLTDNLPLIKSNIVFEGGDHYVDGANTYRVFFVGGGDPQTAPTVTFRNLTIQHGKAQGGAGSCGGAGLGGGMFVYDGDVTLENVAFANNAATGGNSVAILSGGGGGMGGGGGLWAGATGGSGGGGTGTSGGSAGNYGGGGGCSYNNCGAGGGLNSGAGAVNGYGSGGGLNGSIGGSGAGGAGGWGGGGGGVYTSTGGAGGFGGGGGGGGSGSGGAGGFGGGGGIGLTGGSNSSGGFGGGAGNDYNYSGGGAGFGGGLFARAGTLTLKNVEFDTNAAGHGTGANNGLGKGGGLFICKAGAGTGEISHATAAECAAAVAAESCGVTFSGNTAEDDAAISTDNDNVFGNLGSATEACSGGSSPTLQSVYPPRNAVTARRATTVTATYDVAMAPSSVTSATFVLHGMQSGAVLATHGVVGDNTLIVTPTRAFHQGELVYATATTRTQNLAGTPPLTATQWQFNAGVVRDRCVAGFTEVYPGSLPATGYSSAAWGDYDGDGDLDILLTGDSGGYIARVYENTGAGFTEAYAGSLTGVGSSSVAWGDYDGDGDLDILLTGDSGSGYVAQVYANTGAGFAEVYAGSLTGVKDSSVAWGDYDNDGDLDILLTGRSAGSVPIAKVYENTGAGFTEAYAGSLTGVGSSSADWGDYDNDGDLDILLTGWDSGYATNAKVYENTGAGFAEVYAGSLPGVQQGSVAWGDYDNDGDLDILLTGRDSGGTLYARVYQNTGAGFTEAYPGSLPGVSDGRAAWGDYDNDGDLDILLPGIDSGGTRVTKIYQNTGAGFTEVHPASLTGVSSGSVVWGDYDNDGDLDILLTGRYTSRVSITKMYRNDDCVPALTLSKAVTPTTNVAYHGVVTYTMVLSNAGGADDATVVLTDTLPGAVNFGAWIENPGANVSGDEITWNGVVTAASAITFTFTAQHTGAYGDIVTNTAEFSGTVQAASASATFGVMVEPTCTAQSSGNWSVVFAGCPVGNKIIIPAGIVVTLDGNVTLTGDLEVQGTLTPNGKTVTLSGADGQRLIGHPLTFYNLVVDMGDPKDKVIVNGKLIVAGKLTVIEGRLRSASEYGEVEIQAAGALEQAADIIVYGDWTNNGEFSGITATVTFAGSALQTISGTATTAFNHLVISPTAQVFIATTPTVTGTFTNKGTLSQPAQTVNNTTVSFNLGAYPVAVITTTANLGAVNVTVRGNQDCTTKDTDPLIQRCYDITPATSGNATIRFYYSYAELNGQTPSGLKVWHWGPGWTEAGDTYTRSTCGVGQQDCWVEVQHVSDYSPFTLGSGAAPTSVALGHLAARGGLWGMGLIGMLAAGVMLVWRRKETRSKKQEARFVIHNSKKETN